MEFYRNYTSPILGKLDSETWHVRTRQALHLAETTPAGLMLLSLLNYGRGGFEDSRLKVTLGKNCSPKFQVHLDNRTIVGAGWDKVGHSVRTWHTLGAAGVSIGAVLPNAQYGNDKPRQWYFEKSGVAFNRLGFNSPGKEVVRKNLTKYLWKDLKIGLNVGINKDTTPTEAPAAYAEVVGHLWPYVSWIEINVSSPNTKDLRILQDAIYLKDIAQAVNSAQDQAGGRKPTYTKIAPDLPREGISGVIQVTVDNNWSGIVACNTTNNDKIKARYGVAGQLGGISGQDLDYISLINGIITFIRRETSGIPDFEIQGVGGVNNALRAQEKFNAGADVVQVVTGIREIGPTIFSRINRQLAQNLNHAYKYK